MAARSHRSAEPGRAGSGDEGLREEPGTARGKGRRRGAAIPRRKGSKAKLKALSVPLHGRALPRARRGSAYPPARLGTAARGAPAVQPTAPKQPWLPAPNGALYNGFRLVCSSVSARR